MATTLASLLDDRRVTLELRAQTREEALREIVATMGVKEPGKFLAAVCARESVQSTFMGNGVALPHARTDLVQTIVLGIGRSRAGVPFGENGELAHLLFVIGVPQRMVKDYLVCVGALARIAKEASNRAALMNAATAAEFVELLRGASLLLE